MANSGNIRKNCRLILDHINYLCITEKISADEKKELLEKMKKTLQNGDRNQLIIFLKTRNQFHLYDEIIELI